MPWLRLKSTAQMDYLYVHAILVVVAIQFRFNYALVQLCAK